MRATGIRIGLAVAGLGVLGLAWIVLTFGQIADRGPGFIYVYAPFAAAILFSLTLPSGRPILRGFVAAAIAFGLTAKMAGPWYDADIAENGPMPWRNEAVAMTVGFIGIPGSLITGAVVCVGSWLWARRRAKKGGGA